MSHPTLEFDGVRYPYGTATEPATLGLMHGSPPPRARQILFEEDRCLQFPQIRWTLSHLRELVPTASVWRGRGTPSELRSPSATSMADIDALAFDDLTGRRTTWSESLDRTYTDGILALHRGTCIYERYFGELQPQRPHACFSITKSYAATLAAVLLHEGALQEDRLVTDYLPELRGTAFAGATVRQVLDMQVAIAGSEQYSDPRAAFWDYFRAGGFRARPGGYDGPRNFYDYLCTLRQDGEHGHAFSYKTANTEVLCWIMRRITGASLADMLSERIWSQIGCEEDSYLAVDSTGVPMGGAGLNATLRDLARFGELMRCDGAWASRQLIPAAVVADIRHGADTRRFALAGYTLLAGYSYRNMWWVAHDSLGAFEGRGIYGQRLYVAPAAELVVARFGSHPIAASAANDPITLPALRSLAAFLMR